MLEWLQQEYWSRQLGSGLAENWDSQSEGEDGEEDLQRQEDELITRQKEIESYSKLETFEHFRRRLLPSYIFKRYLNQLFPPLFREGTRVIDIF